MIRIAIDPFPSPEALDALSLSAWGHSAGDYGERVLPKSLAHLGAFDGDQLVGFVNVAWDGGMHAFILDTAVHTDYQRRGIATDLVRRAAEVARERGATWLHVDYEPHLEAFYLGCGFRPTKAGLLALR